jgi:FdhD protein
MDLPLEIHGITHLRGRAVFSKKEPLAVEAPLTIVGNGEETMTLRTPGDDRELCLGFLYAEVMVASAAEVLSLHQVSANRVEANVVLQAPLRARTAFASCGFCGSRHLALPELLAHSAVADVAHGTVSIDMLKRLPQRMAPLQKLFKHTGATHAAALFRLDGECIALYEDIGRHNALDKLLGFALQSHLLPFPGIVCLSGRAGFELIAKSAMAKIPIVCSVSAPSALAVELAASFNMTLVGFLRGDRANIYCGQERIAF